MTDGLSPNMAASLATDGHVYCAGALSQCLNRWNRLSTDQKETAFLKFGPDGMTPTFIRGEELKQLASNLELRGLREKR
jgi:hypothetical protein